ncbi:multicopper oxidase family protein [Nonomuraea sp. NPDC050536]|uniref:multicopper oxidase family protein n=1 Tax=Nonomuraea sp. NPDC050536 TaxID=3364366 RepID=UPI0037CB49F8
MRMSRRAFLGTLGVTALGAVSFGGLALPGPAVVSSTARLPRPFTVPLPVPPVAVPVRRDAGTDYYEIVQREADVEILPGLRTRILSYDGTFPGPTVAGRSGRRVVVTHRNRLAEATSTHLHGGHTPAGSDGHPTDLVGPGSSRDYVYPGAQRAATLWYHDHRMDFTGADVYRGLAGFHLVRDAEEEALPLPRREREVPLMIADRAFAEDGSLIYPGMSGNFMNGVLGDVVLVNGAPWPVFEVEAARYRLRLLNASNARRYGLALEPGLPYTQIGSDGGLLERPVTHDEIQISPGERYDVIVDFSGVRPGGEVTMRNTLGSGSTAQVMRFRVTRRTADESRIPARLARVERLDPARAVRTREWRFSRDHDSGMWLINGLPYAPDRVDAAPRLGEVEIWRFVTELRHPVHVHLDPFQVISRRGEEPGPLDGGWKDTVDVSPSEYVDVAVRFTDYPGRYLVHCHNLEHEDMAMMATFATT